MNYVSEPDYPKYSGWYCTGCQMMYTLDNALDVHVCKIVNKVTIGVLFRLTSAWIGVHYSKTNRRACINLVPFVTIWIARKGGRRP
jgi:hypothetical protein